jgi:TPR repeat protein
MIPATAQQEPSASSSNDSQKSNFEDNLTRAKAGDADAQYELSLLYHSGVEVEKSETEAAYWLEKAAQNNHSEAQVEWGKSYFRRQEYRQSMEWFLKAAQAGNADAQHWMAYIYHNGIGIQRNFAEAMLWDMKSAANGFSAAMDTIGYMYEHGEGVTIDYSAALKWYNRAAAAGNIHGQSNLASLYFNGRGVPQDFAKAAELYTKPAAEDLAEAQYALGFILVRGFAGKTDSARGIYLLQKAAAQNDPNASAYLALLYVADEFPQLPHDRGLAKKLAEPLAVQGNIFAERTMAVVESENQHYKGAFDWYQKAANQGDVVSVVRLAQFYRDGKGVAPDQGIAARLFTRATEMDGNAMFLYEAAWFFATQEDPTVRNPELALRYALRAMAQTDGHNVPYLHTLAEAYFANGDLSQAISTEQRALALQPGMPQLKESLARFQAALKQKSFR